MSMPLHNACQDILIPCQKTQHLGCCRSQGSSFFGDNITSGRKLTLGLGTCSLHRQEPSSYFCKTWKLPFINFTPFQQSHLVIPLQLFIHTPLILTINRFTMEIQHTHIISITAPRLSRCLGFRHIRYCLRIDFIPENIDCRNVQESR